MATARVPGEFKPHHPFDYPPGNSTTFEEWISTQHIPDTEREYLPVFWTSYYCKHKYGKDRNKMRNLQLFINSLHGKYWTVCQYDDSILNSLNNIDIKIYGMGGGRIDFPLPLICQPHKYKFEVERDVFASFTGALNHPTRSQMISELSIYNNYVLSTKKTPIKEYCELMARSIFALCPRGYGKTSFRICEALQFGSVPVYISDEFIFPFNKDFNEYGVVITRDQIPFINNILSSFNLCNIHKKREAGKKAYKEMFTYEGCYKMLIENL